MKLSVKHIILAVSVSLTLVAQPVMAAARVPNPTKPVIGAVKVTETGFQLSYKIDTKNSSQIKRLEYSINGGAKWLRSLRSPIKVSGLSSGVSYAFQLRQTAKTGVVTKVSKSIKILGTLIESPKLTGFTVGKLLWSDEFNQKGQAKLDEASWTARYCGGDGSNGGGTCYNNESQYYLPSAITLDGSAAGNAVITTRHINAAPAAGSCFGTICSFTSGRFDTQGKVAFQYGLVETRMKMPKGAGNWPAFWMLGDNSATLGWPASGEIDIAEQGGDRPTRNSGAVHYSTTSSGCCDNHRFDFGETIGTTDYSEDYHTYSLAWLPGQIGLYVDGELFFSSIAGQTQSSIWPFNNPFFLIFDNAIGPQDGSAAFGGQWSGWNESKTQIDWVRVFELNHHGVVTKK